MEFDKLDKNQRKLIQRNLKELDFYKSSIDGLYGKNTYVALETFNKQNFKGANLKKIENVKRLLNKILLIRDPKKISPSNEPNKTYITQLTVD